MSAANCTGLFSRAIRYKGGPKYGFIVFPHDNEVPEGWGDPTKDASGRPIKPGTEGGPNPNRFLALMQDDGWESFRSRSRQVAGPVDWKGPLQIPENPESKRTVLSYWGPNSRHVNYGFQSETQPLTTKFEYGSDSKHQEIYVSGKLLAIAPHPVLGAALKTITYDLEVNGLVTPVTERWLVTILKVVDRDECWIRPMPEAKFYDSVTDEDRYDMVQEESTLYPDGWRNIGGFLKQTNALPAETPWFFNESCTEARCVRRETRTYDPGDASSQTDNVFIEYKMKLTLNEEFKTAVFSSLGLPADHIFQYTEKCEKWQQSWLYNDDPAEEWQEDILEMQLTMDGRMLIAVDFRGDQLIKAYLDQDSFKAWWLYWMLGVGANNSGRVDGEEVPRNEAGRISSQLPGDHLTSQWFQPSEVMYLRIVNESTGATELEYTLQYIIAGSKTLHDTGVDVNTDTHVYFWDGIITYLHHLDLRSLFLVGRSQTISHHWGDFTVSKQQADIEWMQPNTSARDPFGSAVTYPLFHRWTFYGTVSEYWLSDWYRAEMVTWPTTISQSITRVTYAGGWLDPNKDEALYTPYFWDGYLPDYETLEMAPYMRIWPIEHVLGGTENYPYPYMTNAVYGTDEGGNFMAHYECKVAGIDGETVLVYGLSPELEPHTEMRQALPYGDRFFPGGVL